MVTKWKDRDKRFSILNENRRKPFDGLVTQELAKRFEQERVMVRTATRMAYPATMVNNAQIALYSYSNLLDWKTVLTTAWNLTGDYFAKTTFEALREAYPELKAERQYDHKAMDAWDWAVESYITNVVGSKIKYISDTTLDSIRAVVQRGMKDGKSVPEIADDINNLYSDEIIPFRAPIIARTEVSAASNYGNRVAAKSFDMELMKHWVAIIDGKTRPAHAEASGDDTWYPIDEPYIVGGESLMFPGDTSLGASAGNVVNCRCSEVYRIADRENDW